MKQKKNILVAPLHWGLGHATRCIPIIQALLNSDYRVTLASDGAALALLKMEFPSLESLELPSYNIQYSRKGAFLKMKLLFSLPQIRRTISEEKKLINGLVKNGKIDGIISDNRLGVYSNKVPSVFITHQLNVLSGNTSWLSSKAHQRIIMKFNECWVPDIDGPGSLSGKLGHLKRHRFPVKYIGPLSRMKPQKVPVKYDILCLLSGPEPQREMLEKRLINCLRNSGKKVVIVRGVVEEVIRKQEDSNLTIINFLPSEELEKNINESDLVICRSGYTSIMDLAIMGKKAFLIPTPGQYEQQYLAKRLASKKWVPYCKQEDFNLAKLDMVSNYKGLQAYPSNKNLEHLFRLFERE
ncbi:MAG: glycosyltransferase [Flavobacterium sp.]|nr:MAG: glycosyltransferase [Flavobacterium sp.]